MEACVHGVHVVPLIPANSEAKIRLSALDIGLDKLPAIARALCPPRDGLDGTVSHGAMLASMVHAMGSWCIGLG